MPAGRKPAPTHVFGSLCEDRGVRVLVSSPGGIGHATPLVPLTLALAAAGAEVQVACPSPAAERLARIGLPVSRIGLSAEDAHELCLEQHPEIRTMPGPELPGYVFPRLFGSVTASAQFPELLELARSWRPSVLVHDAGDLAAPVVAAALEIPNVCHGFGTAIPAATVAAAAERTQPLWDLIGVDRRPYGGCFDHLYIDPFPPSLQPDGAEHLGHVIGEAPQPAPAAPGETLPAPVVDALADGMPLVHVTFGTVYNQTPDFDAAVAAASRLDAVVLVTVGPNGDPGAFRGYGPTVHVERFVAQSLVMPRTAVLASHAGSGTVLAAFQQAVPQLCLPQAADQFRNAAAVAASGAGTALTSAAEPDHVEGLLRHLIDDQGVRDAAADIAAEIRAMPSAHEVALAVIALAPTTDAPASTSSPRLS